MDDSESTVESGLVDEEAAVDDSSDGDSSDDAASSGLAEESHSARPELSQNESGAHG